MPITNVLQQPSSATRLIFVNRYFHPDHSASSQLLSDLAFALVECGKQVEVITSRQRYDAPEVKLPARERVRDVEVHRVWTSSFGRHNLLGRAVDYITFYFSAAGTLWRLTHKVSIVIAKTDPPMLSVLVVPLAVLRGAKVVNWLQDVFPEVAEALGLGHGRLARLVLGGLRTLRNWSLRRATMNVAVGQRMSTKLEALGADAARVRIIPNWADGTLITPIAHSANPLRKAWGLEGKFVLAYSGNLGRAHEYSTLLDAISQIEARQAAAKESASSLVERPRTQLLWLFIGGGSLYRMFEAEVGRRGLTSVQFRPYQPRGRLGESLSAADVHLVSLRPELEGLIVPSKFYGIAAAGRATIFIGDAEGEIGRLLAETGLGWTVASNNGLDLAARVEALVADPDLVRETGARARRIFEQRFDFHLAVARWAALLDEVRDAPWR